MHVEGITLAAVVNELRQSIQGGFIQQIYQPLADLLVLKLYTREKHSLLIAASQDARVHLTEQKYENPSVPSPFCMLLRKHLKGGRIEEIHQPNWERIVDFSVVCHQGVYVLRAELIGSHSNVILLKDDAVVGALKVTSGQRKLVPHAHYAPPSPQDKLNLRMATKEELFQALQAHADKSVKQGLLGTIDGIGPRSASEIVLRARLQPEETIASLSKEELGALWEVIDEFFSRIVRGNLEPCVYLKAGEPFDCTPFPFVSYSRLEVRRFERMSQALDACHRERHQEPFERLTRVLAQQLKHRLNKTEKALSQLMKDLADAERFQEYKERGDLLITHLRQIKKGQRQIEVEDLARGGKRVISLDPTLDPAANAQRYYERYKKLKRGVEKLTERRHELEMEISYLQNVGVQLEQAENLEELRELQAELELEGSLSRSSKKRSQPVSSGPRRYPIDGFLVLVGRNGRQNDALIRQANREEYWLHAKDRPGAHVVIMSDQRGAVPPERVLLRAAQLAAYYSRGRGSTKVPVTYTRVKYLRKPKGARPGLVTVTREEGTLIVSPKEEE